MNAFWKGFSAILWISEVFSVGMKYRRRAIVTVWDPSTMQKFASKTILRGPFCGSTGRGDCKTTTPERVMQPAEGKVMMVTGRKQEVGRGGSYDGQTYEVMKQSLFESGGVTD